MLHNIALIGLFILFIAAKPAPEGDPKIQVALLLDTSGSMDGLLEQAKSQLWKLVNELATSKRNGKVPQIELALYEYGKSSLNAGEGYLQAILPLSSDLDLVSEKLFALSTNGGDEYCGWAIKDATDRLEWSDNPKDLKIIIIAGNESFAQGEVDYKISCKNAITKSIVVNTIYCGDCDEGVHLQWKDGADRADGRYLCINQNSAVVHIETPYDKKISALNDSLNTTYIAFGKEGEARQQRQVQQDANASTYGAANLASRVISKSKKSAYNNAIWDVVDAAEANDEFIEEVEEEALPEPMQKMDMEERKAYIAEKAAKRKAIQEEIQAVAKKREAYMAEERKAQSESTENTLDAVMLKTIREQAEKQGYQFEKKS